MMRGFPHVLRNVRALDLNRGCVPLALRTPRVWGTSFCFLCLLNHTDAIICWISAGEYAHVALFAFIVHGARRCVLQLIPVIVLLLFI